VFAAGDAKTPQFAPAVQAPERYGAKAGEWKPFFPPKLETVSEIAYAAAKRHELKYREIPVDKDVERELKDARLRQNLTVVVVDPLSLGTNCDKVAAAFDSMAWDGAAVLVPLDASGTPWDGLACDATRKAFPVMSKVGAPAFQAPISAAQDLADRLDDALWGYSRS
jgi:FxsC-like protein